MDNGEYLVLDRKEWNGLKRPSVGVVWLVWFQANLTDGSALSAKSVEIRGSFNWIGGSILATGSALGWFPSGQD